MVEFIKQTRQNNRVAELEIKLTQKDALIEELFTRVADAKSARSSFIEQERRSDEWSALLSSTINDIRDALKIKAKPDTQIKVIKERLEQLDKELAAICD